MPANGVSVPEGSTIRVGSRTIPYRYVITAVACLDMLMIAGSMYSFGVFFKPLANEFDWTSAMTAGAFSIMTLVQGACFMITGRLNDKLGTKFVISSCGLLLGLAFFLISRINSLWQLYLVFGTLLPLGLSGGFVPLLSTVARHFSSEKRGMMSGIVAGGAGAGMMIIPPIANLVIAEYGWRNSYMMLGPLVSVVLIGTAPLLRNPGRPAGVNSAQSVPPWTYQRGNTLFEAVRAKRFWLAGASFFCFGVFVHGISVHMTPNLINLGFSTVAAGNIFIAIGAASVTARVLSGLICDRISSRRSIIIYFLIGTASFAWLLASSNLLMYFIFAIGFGIAFGGLGTVQSVWIADLFGMKSHGVILGCNAFICGLGGALGPFLVGSIFDAIGSYVPGFWIMLAITAIGGASAWLIKPGTFADGTYSSNGEEVDSKGLP